MLKNFEPDEASKEAILENVRDGLKEVVFYIKGKLKTTKPNDGYIFR